MPGVVLRAGHSVLAGAGLVQVKKEHNCVQGRACVFWSVAEFTLSVLRAFQPMASKPR